ncbi:MAG: lipid-A-disaccharide synthase, partial [Parvibaculum sp.]|nr:lipid-A-disaccharide synthase [Parvibaculum sp.]
MTLDKANELHIMLVAGETSGDALGADLMVALREISGRSLRISGVGGPRMEREGLASIFPMSDIAVMGPREIVPRLPLILHR